MKYPFSIIFYFLSSTLVHAQSTLPGLISASEHSGFVQRQHAYTRECSIDANQSIVLDEHIGLLENGTWETENHATFPLPPHLFAKLQTWISDAANGTIKNSPVPCDIGSAGVSARSGNKDLMIYSLQDCAQLTTNESTAAKNIVEFIKDYCNFSHL
jgi:hypothetical protein